LDLIHPEMEGHDMISVSKKTRIVLLICAMMLISGVPAGASMDADTVDTVTDLVAEDAIFTGNGYDNMLRFNDLEFDPSEGVSVPPELRAITDYYIVQFDGPINEGWKDDLRDLGVRFFWYLPNFGFIARLPSGTMEDVGSHAHVRAVYPYHTAFKVPKDMWYSNFDPSPMDLVAVPLEDEAGLAAEIEGRGGIVYDFSDHEVLFTLRGDMFLDIARLPQTGWIQPFSEPTVMNDNYGRTIGVRQQSDGAFANDGDSLWSYNSGNYPGLSAGEEIIVAVYDTGMDTTHPAYQNTPGDQPKLVWFKDYNDGSENDWHDTGSHGTHTESVGPRNEWKVHWDGPKGQAHRTGRSEHSRRHGIHPSQGPVGPWSEPHLQQLGGPRVLQAVHSPLEQL
jgi:hypothetical protein